MSNRSLPSEIMLDIIENLNSLEDVQNFCSINKNNYDMCKDYGQIICKYLLKILSVDYKDPTNFIYVYNNVDIDDYKKKEEFNFVKILNLYKKSYYLKKIKCVDRKISSFPIYPNMTICSLNNNNLTSFPIQPRMIYCFLNNNNLTTFPIQPHMTNCDLSNNNNLTKIPNQPKCKCELIRDDQEDVDIFVEFSQNGGNKFGSKSDTEDDGQFFK